MIFDGYAPTVRSHPVPLYMRGYDELAGLGQDSSIDTGFADPGSGIVPPDLGTPSFLPTTMDPGIFPSTDPALQPLIDSGLSPDAASLLADAASSGAITNAQFQQVLNSRMSSTAIENLILGAGNFARVAAAPGAPTANRPPTSPATSIVRSATDVAKAAAASNQANLGPGASPRVSTAAPGWTSGKTAIAGLVIPNLVLLGVGGVLLLAATKGGR